jgi:hypothetical protein
MFGIWCGICAFGILPINWLVGERLSVIGKYTPLEIVFALLVATAIFSILFGRDPEEVEIKARSSGS